MFALSAVNAYAQTATTPAIKAADALHDYRIPAGPLGSTLIEIARQANVTISVNPQLVQGLQAPAIQGRLHVNQAVQQALAGQKLELARTANGTLTVQSRTSDSPQGAETTLPVVQVNGSDAIGYVALRGGSATKTDTPLLETPMSISVITRAQMDAQAVQTVEQSLRYTAGVLTEITGYDLRYASLNIRGFDATLYRDGLRVFKSGTYGDWLADPQGIERVEVLKGPVATLYGQGGPGGLVNQVSKRPVDASINDVTVSAGNHARYQTTFDFNRSLNEDGSLLFRVNGLARDAKTQTDYSQDNRFYVAPALTWKPNAATSLTILADYTQDRMTPKSWWPNESLLKTYNGRSIPVRAFAGEPGFDHYNRDMASLAYLFEHRFDDTLVLRHNVRYADFKLDYQHVYARDVVANTTRVNRSALISRVNSRVLTADTHLQKDLNTGSVKHKLLVGVDYQDFSGTEDLNTSGTASQLDIFNPVYGGAVTVPSLVRSTATVKQYGLYLQDQMKWGQWIVNAGLRRDKAETSRASGATTIQVDDGKTTGNLGLLYLFNNGLAPYASYSTSFAPVIGTNFNGTPQPETGEQFEIGMKYQPVGSNSFLAASLFDLRKQNVTTVDPNNPARRVQTGEVRSRGLELEGKASLTRRLDLIASYTWLDPEITKSNTAAELGKMPFQTVRHTSKLWIDYTFSNDVLPGWGIGAGVRKVGKSVADVPANLYFNPGYTLVDAAVHYQSGPIRFSLNAANLFDKVTLANRAQFYGQGRTITATLGYRW
ncbi:TonB-dependent siderophore receptor [Oxalicibacterium faecigallinarum]|nr:TonB-dependent siderophore receptor [Oxalicibacterium faecigallinarum]